MAKRVIPRSKLPNRKLNQMIRYFVLEVSARSTAKELGIHCHSVERIYTFVRQCMAHACEEEMFSSGEVEVDESYFGGKRKGNRGRGAAGKVAVFGILKRNGKVYTIPVPDVSAKTLRQIIKQRVPEGSTVYSDQFKSYDGLVTHGYKHYRINHDEELVKNKKRHINGIENFWGFAKTKLRRYYGVRRSHFSLYLKEMEFRYNHRNENMLSITRKIVKRFGAVLC